MNNTMSHLALAALEEQNLPDFEGYFHQALGKDDPAVLRDLGYYLEQIGFYDYAKQVYQHLVGLYPDLHLHLAQILAEEGDSQGAFLQLDHITKESDDYIYALLIMADLYQMEGLLDVACQKLELAHQLSDDPIVTFGLAECYFDSGSYKEAIKYYADLDNRAILKQTGVSTYERIGKAYASLGQFEAAISFLEKALEIDYQDDLVYQLAVLYYDQADYIRANHYFKQLDSLNPDFAGYEYLYAKSLSHNHDLQKARLMIEKGLKKNPFDSQLFVLAAKLAYEAGDLSQSKTYLLSAQEVADDLDLVFLPLSKLYLEMQDYEALLDLTSYPIENALTRWHIAKAYRKLERDQEALKRYGELLPELNHHPEFLEDYAYFAWENGDRQTAKQLATAYLKYVPDDVSMATFLSNLDDKRR